MKNKTFHKGNKISYSNDKQNSGHGTWIILKCLEVLQGTLDLDVVENSVITTVYSSSPKNKYRNCTKFTIQYQCFCNYDSDIQRKIYNNVLIKQLKLNNIYMWKQKN